MKLQLSKHLFCFILCLNLIVIINDPAYSQFSVETGLFPISNFTPEDYNNAMPQNSAIIQDHRGIMYFGNDEGILEYDGIKWRIYTVTNETPVKSLAIDKNGRIFVGAVGELGYLIPNEQGRIEYKSLIDFIDEDSRDFSEVWYTHSCSHGIYFQTSEYIYLWDGKEMKDWRTETFYHTSFIINDKLIVDQSEIGLMLLDNDSLIKIDGSEVFFGIAIFAILPYENEKLLIVTGNSGFYEVKFGDDMESMTSSPLSIDFKGLCDNYAFFNAIKINDNTYSIGTWGSGLLIFQKGKILQLITKKSGLSNEIINYQYLDKDNNLWLALSHGITKIEINSPLSKFTENLGIEGTIEAIARFNDKLYMGTDRGLLYLPSEVEDLSKLYEQSKFVKLTKFTGGCWDVLDYNYQNDNHLIVLSDEAILQLDKSHQFKTIQECFPYKLYQSKVNPERVYVGLGNGLLSMVRKSNEWQIEYEFPEIDETIFNLAEDQSGNLWLGTIMQGVLRVEKPFINDNKDIKIKRYSHKNGLPENSQTYITTFQDEILFGTNRGVYKFDEAADTFLVADHLPTELINKDWLIHRMKPNGSEKMWISVFIQSKRMLKVGYLSKENSEYKWTDTPFNTISKGEIHSIHIDDDKTVWFGGSSGLYRYDPFVQKDYVKDFASVIRMNITSGDSIFFGSYFDENGYVNTIQSDVLKPTLKYKYNTLNFEFSAQNPEVEHPILFSYYLEGYDKKWSEWSEEPKRYYTNLNEGTYTFRVKAKNIYDHQSEEASYEFVILPPWYRTILAYISYVLLLIALIYVIVTQYTKYLRGVIKLKTKEIRRQKEVVEHKNEEIMDSIKYAQRIQAALLPPKEILVESETDYFILFKPRDIVSGDFYWFRKIGDFIVIVAADCTGHGVPGAFVSMLGMAFLNEIAVQIEEVKANEVLNMLRAQVIKSLRQTGKEGESKDGMDIALYVIDKKNMKLQFAGANNPLILIRNKELNQIKGDRMPIGYHLVMDEFKNNELDIEKGDMLYTFSDGYQDQFGGEDGSKFKIKKLKQLMVEISEKQVDEQHKILDDTIENWKGTEEQIDDILLIGVRI